ncbi:MAG: response regulator [Blastocatellia bacterium]
MIDTKGRILFVDDDLDTCEMMRILLGMAGYEAVSASCVSEGLDLARSGDFDLILLDWHLRDGNGIDLCRMIRAFDGEIPIFFYTGVAYESELKKALKAGAQGCLVKPVDVNDLMRTVSRYSSSKDAEQNRGDRREQRLD